MAELILSGLNIAPRLTPLYTFALNNRFFLDDPSSFTFHYLPTYMLNGLNLPSYQESGDGIEKYSLARNNGGQIGDPEFGEFSDLIGLIIISL